jgi:hypothetical protein
MSTLSRILASRANGALSRGPVTREGKKRSSQNAVTHGLLARTTLMEGESPDALKALFTEHLACLLPAGTVELGMVQEMVAAYWRLRRAWAIETRTLDKEVAIQSGDDQLDRMAKAFTSLADKPALALLNRYETRLHLIYHRALQNLLLLRLAQPNEPRKPPRVLSGGRAGTRTPDLLRVKQAL